MSQSLQERGSGFVIPALSRSEAVFGGDEFASEGFG